ncbi:uncharacterized protein PHACADRAFT_254245 [Phanerochaete carnosa HHB-10118-sp]|uniref:Uncharacterized protein n=1 Tax=Phanerochaete carnosa (strain HHB-10118-sp) TaxID=650164 RepID=K5WCD2_PHACS|nr:uncharacterized protein PHACADRAFT_254245 [Phanerochaete carnosa HHB-10118-sp]EKM56880.1 hypothetical protein PHACADRAFT_254245 [Phanerochaete carnosa HHB-10118-sp]
MVTLPLRLPRSHCPPHDRRPASAGRLTPLTSTDGSLTSVSLTLTTLASGNNSRAVPRHKAKRASLDG